jgi:hypothetical protein
MPAADPPLRRIEAQSGGASMPTASSVGSGEPRQPAQHPGEHQVRESEMLAGVRAELRASARRESARPGAMTGFSAPTGRPARNEDCSAPRRCALPLPGISNPLTRARQGMRTHKPRNGTCGAPGALRGHAGCGKRPGETDRSKDQHRAPGQFHHDRAGKTTVTSKDDLKATVISGLRRLQKLPGLVRGFFADPCLRYITE